MAAALWAANADLILYNGKIVTVDEKFSIAQAVAIKGGKITAVGDTKAVLAAQRGPRTQRLDLKGRTVLPGLVDSHVHALSAGLSEFRHPLPPLDSFAAIQDFIREQVKTTPKGEWIVVPRTFPTRLKELRMPTRELLDVATEHPVMFDASYTVVVNSRALAMSGITRTTPNPPGGEIVRDAKGEPNGILKNAQLLLKGLDRSESFSEAEKLEALEKMLRRYVAAGLTAIGDRAVTPEEIGLYEKLKAEKRLPVRAVLTWRIDASKPVEELIRQIRTAPYATGKGDAWLKFGALKVTLDGGMTIGTAYQRLPYGPFGRQLYGHTEPKDRGLLFIAPEKLKAIERAAHARGWQLTAHDQGGGAVDAFLTALEAADSDRPLAASRSHLMHASFESPEAIARAKKLGLLIDAQSAWLYYDAPALEEVFSYDAMRYFYPMRSYLDAGLMVAGGSDHMIGFDKNRAVNPYNPFLQIWMAVTRQTVQGEPFHPEEKITREEALKTHTIWAAYMQFAELERGSIEPAKLADLVVIDRDFLACPEEEIKAIEPELVIIGGKTVFQ
ncbi:MAG: amidohydrolase [Acidobacteria bacterium]|nr:amidohydrolase [Acidobacteriota bacterium]